MHLSPHSYHYHTFEYRLLGLDNKLFFFVCLFVFIYTYDYYRNLFDVFFMEHIG